MELQQLFGTCILLVDHLLRLLVNQLCCVLAVRLIERILLIIIIAQVGQTVAHAGVGNHAVSLLRHALQVVHRTGRNRTHKELLSGATTQGGTHLVEHLLLRRNLTLLRQVPGSTQRTTTRHDGHLNQRVGMLQEPREGSVTRLMQRDGTFLLLRHHLRLLLQTTDDTVHRIQEVLFTHESLVMACSNQRCLITYIGNIGARESRCLTSQQVHIHRCIQFQRTQVNTEYLLTLVQVGQVHMNLTVESSGTQ